MSDTPRTDEFISDNVIGCAQGDYPIDAALKLMGQLEIELNELKEWKRQQLLVEGTWDAQAVGKLINVNWGENIRPKIQPYIEELQSELNEAKETIESMEQELRAQTYRGNSIGYIYDKMKGYGAGLDRKNKELNKAKKLLMRVMSSGSNDLKDSELDNEIEEFLKDE